MKYTHDEIEELAEILEDEARGLPIDHGECGRLAILLAKLYPEISSTMWRIGSRMAAVSRISPSDGEEISHSREEGAPVGWGRCVASGNEAGQRIPMVANPQPAS